MNQNYSVLMSVYKKENPKFLKMAIESMLNQSTPTNDFVLVCDGPLTQELNFVINEFVTQYKQLFHVLRLPVNMGLGNALNSGIFACKNSLIARMDSDDISLPKRCEMQLNQFQKDSQLALCSGYIAEFENEIQHIKTIRQVPTAHEDILKYAKKRNPMNHMAIMYRKDAVLNSGNYIEVNMAEDYYLWIRMLQKGYKASNIDSLLVYVRTGNGMYKRRGGWKYVKNIYHLEKMLFNSNFISYPEFLRNCSIRISVGLIPSKAREYFYQKKLRNSIKYQTKKYENK